MKKLISFLCVITMVIGLIAVSVVGASAAVEGAKTAVDVKAGDEISYALTLGDVADPVIGCDFSFYYDSSLFELVSVADFNDSTNRGSWLAAINPDLDGEVRGNWSILNGVDFSTDRNMFTVTLKAKSEGTGHLSYYIRYMYDNNIFNSDDRPQITSYKFTCTVLQNGEPVLEKAPPELNVEETQTTGLFVNTVTGDSKDADANIPGTVVKKNDTNSQITPGYVAPTYNTQNSGGGTPNTTATTAPGSTEAQNAAPAATTADGYFVTATDAQGNVTATSDQAPVTTTGANGANGGASPVLWIIIALVVLAGGGAAAYFYMKKKPAAPAENAKPEE